MRARRHRRSLGVAGFGVTLALLLPLSRAAVAQSGDGAPDMLSRTMSLTLSDVPLGDALLMLRRTHGIPLAWSGDVVPPGLRVSISVHDAPVRSLLATLLEGSGLHVVVTRQGAIVIVPRPDPDRRNSADSTSSAGVVIDRGLMATGVQQLDQVVVIGSSVAGGPEREQPTAVNVVSRDRLSSLNQPRLTDIVRTELPALMLWDRGPTGPPAPFAAVRGVASFTTRALKTYVDGIELASPELFTLVDGRGVEGLEMIRGPQGAALYGPDALNGVVQLLTHRGRLGSRAIGGRVEASGGRYERSGLPEGQPIQDLGVGVTGTRPRAAFDVSGAFTNVGRDSASRQLRSWNTQGGARALLGPVLFELSGRLASHEYMATRVAAAATSPATPQQIEERALSVTAAQQVTEKWRHSIVAGRHWIRGDREPFRSPLLPPRLPAGATFETAARNSVRYASTLALSSQVEVSGGAEHSARDVEREVRRGSFVSDLSTLYSDALRSTGAFGQIRLRLAPQLTLSGGARGERLSSVGPRLGTVWASTAGVSWNREFASMTLRLRSAWGRGIRPPEPGMNVNRTSTTLRQVTNPDLAPERQQGVEGGADLFFGSGGFVKGTWYQQFATDLIQQVSLRAPSGEVDVYQFQNVGVVRNRGMELEAGVQRARLTMGASLHLPRSEVRRLSPRYTGELLPGDRLIEVPEAAASAYVRYAPLSGATPSARRVVAEVGATALGPWTGYDWQLLARIERGQAARRAAVRDYWMRYSGFVRPYVTASFALTPEVRAMARIDNPGNQGEIVRDNASVPLGRTMVVGVDVRRR